MKKLYYLAIAIAIHAYQISIVSNVYVLKELKYTMLQRLEILSQEVPLFVVCYYVGQEIILLNARLANF